MVLGEFSNISYSQSSLLWNGNNSNGYQTVTRVLNLIRTQGV